jgi:hypothetical protein
MAEKNFVSVLTAQAAAETTRTLIASILVPQGVTKLVEVGTQIHMPGYTTVEGIDWIFEIESTDMNPWNGVQQFASDSIIPLVPTNAAVVPSKVHDVNIPVVPGAHLDFYTTFGMLLTINPSMRAFGKFA